MSASSTQPVVPAQNLIPLAETSEASCCGVDGCCSAPAVD
ncbi:hypothetical protein BKA02_000104 [Microbacterium pseudoresistens]|uniref:Uncharacterized protein n=1 Tax=Microbacterium pseudoresistens TaxID=640634 RepID=A0A7Y9JMY1_9MICO|nr:hypothetical protein [Microbacterium pseudoresistens]